MSNHLELVHTADNDPKWHMPYTPAIKVHAGKTVYIAGVTAAPVYHSHPHMPAEFDHIPADAGRQAELAAENLRQVLQAAGGALSDVVQLCRFIVDMEKHQDAINRVMARYFGAHCPTSTTVEVVRLATDPRLVLELTAVAVVPE
ncbi:MAG TPA: RidA family protein [Candidatus Tectomicrobia bacterium]|jgi:enamine deaminase RidA (YjgF/YER057c/UK114 family)